MEDWSQVTHIWEGLGNFRQLRRDIFRIGLNQIDQKALDSLFTGYNFTISFGAKHKLVSLLEKTLEDGKFTNPDLEHDIKIQIADLEKVHEELVLERNMDHFHYEFVFKEESNSLKGFVKIVNKTNPKHVGLMEWSDSNNSVLYLAEVEDNHYKLNISYGDGSLAIIEQPSDLSYKWTHCLEEGFKDLTHAEHGSISMSKMTKNVKLEDANLASSEANRRSTEQQPNGKSLIENNITLLDLYKPELDKLVALYSSK